MPKSTTNTNTTNNKVDMINNVIQKQKLSERQLCKFYINGIMELWKKNKIIVQDEWQSAFKNHLFVNLRANLDVLFLISKKVDYLEKIKEKLNNLLRKGRMTLGMNATKLLKREIQLNQLNKLMDNLDNHTKKITNELIDAMIYIYNDIRLQRKFYEKSGEPFALFLTTFGLNNELNYLEMKKLENKYRQWIYQHLKYKNVIDPKTVYTYCKNQYNYLIKNNNLNINENDRLQYTKLKPWIEKTYGIELYDLLFKEETYDFLDLEDNNNN